jgi:aryl-alcohol dehydrogenase-like predicted oxidoreductase
MAYISINRRTFFRKVGEVAATIAGLGFVRSFPSSCLSGRNAHAKMSEVKTGRTSMNYRRLGKTNILISEISFGGALNYGGAPLGRKLNTTIRNLYAKALELGINFFDTSTNEDEQYVEEETFRYFLPKRDRVYLATKVNDFEPKGMRASIEKSLRRMKTDYIDVVFLHTMDERGGWKKGVPALEEMRKMIGEGKIRFAGVSDHSYGDLIQIGNSAHLVDVIALIYNFDHVYKAEAVISEANSLNIGTLAIKVFGGAYKSWADKAAQLERNANLQPLLSKKMTVAQAAVRFVLSNPDLSSALIGMQSEAQIMDNVKASSEDRAVIMTSDYTRARRIIFRLIYRLYHRFVGPA